MSKCLSLFRRLGHTACVIYISLAVKASTMNGDLKGITFVVPALHEKVALMKSS